MSDYYDEDISDLAQEVISLVGRIDEQPDGGAALTRIRAICERFLRELDGEDDDDELPRIHYVDRADVFVTKDGEAEARKGDLVFVPGGGVEPYTGQGYDAVARVLNFYRLKHSEQWTPRARPALPR